MVSRADSTFLLADPVGRVDDLALEVRQVDDVEVDDADGPDAGRREVQRGRAAEPAGADEEDLRAEERRLAVRPDLGHEEVAAVALLLLVIEDGRDRPGRPLPFQSWKPPVIERDVRVAHALEGLAGEQRADAAGAVEDDRPVAVGDRRLDVLLDVALRDVDRAGDVALLPLGVSRTSTMARSGSSSRGGRPRGR